MTALIECVPNFSEGRRPEVVEQIAEAIRSVPGAHLLDYSSDEDHNRTVVTMVGSPEAVEEAAFRAIAKAADLINMEEHQGGHPRLGATDVVPFVPVRGAKMEECVAIAKRLGQRVGEELSIPVYLYESAASRPDRINLADVRRGEYEKLRDTIESDPDRAPDFGPAHIGPAGGTIIGARPFLIAYNVYLKDADVEVANRISRAIRHSNGGFRFVKGMGLEVEGMAQVSMNLTDFTRTPIHRVQEAIRREAERYGARIAFAELVGMIPQQALIDAARWYLQLDRMSDEQILENRLAALNEDDRRPTTDDR
jgi:glutamate formiminotransferase/formiminotetrahydrofolate cyclodeaminase